MPELPEVESSRRMLLEHCKGASVVEVQAADDSIVIVDTTPKELEAALKGSKVVELHRRGKHLWWELDKGKKAVLFHFGMTGSFVVRGQGATKYKSFSVDSEQWPPRFHKLTMKLSTGAEVAFVDSRRFARIRLATDPLSVSPICDLGPDPILAPPSAQQWADTVGKRTGAIKGVLLDQSVACGVGNWVADEMLFQARIHPETPASALSGEELEALRTAMLDVCTLAVAANADDDKFPRDWLFHTRWHKAGGKVLGHSVSYITVNGRTSAFVPALQKKKGGSGGGASGSKGRKRGPPEEAAGEDGDGAAGGKPAGKRAKASGAGAKKRRAGAGAEGDARPSGAAGETAADCAAEAGTSAKAEAGKAKAEGKRPRGGAKGDAPAAGNAAGDAPAGKKGKAAAAAAAPAGGGRKRKSTGAAPAEAAKPTPGAAEAEVKSGARRRSRSTGAAGAS